METWIRADEMQWVKEINENQFVVLDVKRINYEGYVLHHVEVDISDFSYEELNDEIRGYYDSLVQIKEVYSESWKQIVAEIIAENTGLDTEYHEFQTEEELYEHVKNKYGIEEVE